VELSDELRVAIVSDGYGSPMVFALAMESAEDTNEYIASLLVTRGLAVGPALTDQNYRFSPAAGQLRQLKRLALDSAVAVAAPVAAGPQPLGVLPTALDVGRRLTVEVRRELESEFRRRFPGELLLPCDSPSDQLLQLILTQQHRRGFEVIAWKRMTSLEVSQELKENRAGDSKERSFLAILAASQGLENEETDDVSGSPYKVSQLLTARALAFALVRACHLASWRIYNSRLLQAYTKKVRGNELGLRGPNVWEAEEADRHALREVFRLHGEGWALDEALYELAVTREIFTTLLGPKLRPFKPLPPLGGKNQGQGANRASQAPYQQPQHANGKGKQEKGKNNWKGHHDKGKGRGSGRGNRGGGQHQPQQGHQQQPQQGGQQQQQGGQQQGGQQPPAANLCHRFQRGQCHDTSCRFRHACQRCGSEAHGSGQCPRS
jgi:hypothetical protein